MTRTLKLFTLTQREFCRRNHSALEALASGKTSINTGDFPDCPDLPSLARTGGRVNAADISDHLASLITTGEVLEGFPYDLLDENFDAEPKDPSGRLHNAEQLRSVVYKTIRQDLCDIDYPLPAGHFSAKPHITDQGVNTPENQEGLRRYQGILQHYQQQYPQRWQQLAPLTQEEKIQEALHTGQVPLIAHQDWETGLSTHHTHAVTGAKTVLMGTSVVVAEQEHETAVHPNPLR